MTSEHAENIIHRLKQGEKILITSDDLSLTISAKQFGV